MQRDSRSDAKWTTGAASTAVGAASGKGDRVDECVMYSVCGRANKAVPGARPLIGGPSAAAALGIGGATSSRANSGVCGENDAGTASETGESTSAGTAERSKASSWRRGPWWVVTPAHSLVELSGEIHNEGCDAMGSTVVIAAGRAELTTQLELRTFGRRSVVASAEWLPDCPFDTCSLRRRASLLLSTRLVCGAPRAAALVLHTDNAVRRCKTGLLRKQGCAATTLIQISLVGGSDGGEGAVSNWLLRLRRRRDGGGGVSRSLERGAWRTTAGMPRGPAGDRDGLRVPCCDEGLRMIKDDLATPVCASMCRCYHGVIGRETG